ncbi:lysine N(6)-hydroxylase/L-ornithine N(5)-oxygenase family protein [Pseudoalteromonas rubra]|uniref:lysine N(6)-hydroxylase/L-ornithine N(5)-oxygenase family protein n=1 Tax=Pseudoalteromonas rubra TaxID=43658 RepID=UPI0013DE4C1E|nr:SidA/IucD/PvdA family monooxygenase [Pseudoalteromonas rubra]
MNNNKVYDLIGIGGGVFNLSLAVMLEEQGFENAIFFERNETIHWHPGLLLDTSELQVNFMKDLILPVSPTSKYTFINYLHHRNLLYQFLNRKTDTISRNQFQAYFRWVADMLPSLRMNSTVEQIRHDGELFIVTVNGEDYFAKDISIAAGIKSNVPECAKDVISDDVFHVTEFARRRDALAGQRVSVIGSGQSSAEVFADVFSQNHCKSIHWLGRRYSFAQLEDNCFVNEFYSPSFIKVFKGLTTDKKKDFIQRMEMSSDGINQGLLDNIYRSIFDRKFFTEHDCDYAIRPYHELQAIEKSGSAYVLTFKNLLQGDTYTLESDKVILATGFKSASWDLLQSLVSDEYQSVDELKISDDYELHWQHMGKNRIYVQNTSKMQLGLGDPNLSISAYRAAMIANSILKKPVFQTQPDTPLLGYM